MWRRRMSNPLFKIYYMWRLKRGRSVLRKELNKDTLDSYR